MRKIGLVAYYRATLALPLAIPVAAGLMEMAGVVLKGTIATIFWYSLVIGGIPYSLLAAFMFFWIQGRSEKAIHHVLYVSPFFMVVLLAITAGLFPLVRASLSADRGLVDAIAGYSLLTLVLGYLYVAAVQFGYLSLKAMNRIRPHDVRMEPRQHPRDPV